MRRFECLATYVELGIVATMGVIRSRWRRQSPGWPMPPRSAALTVVAFLVAQAFLIWWERHDSRPPDTDISQRIEVIDGDTVRYGSQTYRLVGFDTPERGYKAHCADERRLADVA